MIAGFISYVLGLSAMNAWYDEHSPYRYWLLLLPVLPLFCIAVTTIRAVSTRDEMHRKIITEAMAFSGIATGFTCFSYLFVRDVGAPEFHAEWAFYLMWLYYGVGHLVSARRYR
jgi:hypothetical protein